MNVHMDWQSGYLCSSCNEDGPQREGGEMTHDEVAMLNPAERSAYANGFGDCRQKFEERPELGKPLGDMSRGELIDALAWCAAELRKIRAKMFEECARIADSGTCSCAKAIRALAQSSADERTESDADLPTAEDVRGLLKPE